jgi:F0F1-type ATP synthase assembly protein I
MNPYRRNIMEIKQRDIDGIANSRTSRRYRWRILAWAVLLVIVGLILYYIWGWDGITTFSMLGQTYHIPFIAIWLLGLAGLALIGCELWSRAQRGEARALAKEYEGKATLFYSKFYPNRFGDTVGSAIQRKIDRKETREIIIAILASFMGYGVIGGLMAVDTGDIFSATPTGIGIGVLGALMVFGSLTIVAALQGKRRLAIMREIGYEVMSDGRNRKWPIALTVIVMVVAAILIAMGIMGANPFYLFGGTGLELASVGYLLFVIYLAAYYKNMKVIELIKVP